MAKFKPGPIVGSISGSVGGATFSHNRFGPYIRRRAIPVTSVTPAALAAKSRFTQASQNWNAITPGERLSWSQWALGNPVMDSLGSAQQLDGHSPFVMINSRLLAAGLSQIGSPPLVLAPAPLTTLTATWDIGSGAFALTFTPSPVGAAISLWSRAAVVYNASITWFENLLRIVQISSANVATGVDLQAPIESIFGVLTVGKRVSVQCSLFNRTTGLLSPPLRVDGTVIST